MEGLLRRGKEGGKAASEARKVRAVREVREERDVSEEREARKARAASKVRDGRCAYADRSSGRLRKLSARNARRGLGFRVYGFWCRVRV